MSLRLSKIFNTSARKFSPHTIARACNLCAVGIRREKGAVLTEAVEAGLFTRPCRHRDAVRTSSYVYCATVWASMGQDRPSRYSHPRASNEPCCHLQSKLSTAGHLVAIVGTMNGASHHRLRNTHISTFDISLISSAIEQNINLSGKDSSANTTKSLAAVEIHLRIPARTFILKCFTFNRIRKYNTFTEFSRSCNSSKTAKGD